MINFMLEIMNDYISNSNLQRIHCKNKFVILLSLGPTVSWACHKDVGDNKLVRFWCRDLLENVDLGYYEEYERIVRLFRCWLVVFY